VLVTHDQAEALSMGTRSPSCARDGSLGNPTVLYRSRSISTSRVSSVTP
jgi:hypothetical protein